MGALLDAAPADCNTSGFRHWRYCPTATRHPGLKNPMETHIGHVWWPIAIYDCPVDGHYSGSVGKGLPDTAKGDADCPLFEELKHISKHPIKSHTILIDDVAEGKLWDGYSLEKIMVKILEINPNYKFDLASPQNFKPNSVLVCRV